VFCPWPDFEEVMRRENIPLFALESRDAIKDFDFIGFTMQYEMSYTNVLNMLDLANIPIKSVDRTDSDPIVCAGGPCTCNIEPMSNFFDFAMSDIGEFILLIKRIVYGIIFSRKTLVIGFVLYYLIIYII
jgi:radical SAM superfamily enzyme YgiQ (UPF0313 family)